MFKWRLNDIRYLLSLTLPSFGYILNRGHCISYCESRVHSEKIGDYTIVALNKELFDGKRRKFIKEGNSSRLFSYIYMYINCSI